MMEGLILIKPAWIRSFAGAWIFYSILPSWPWITPKFERIARFAPLIGLLIGGLQAILWLSLNWLGWPKESITLVVIALGAWLTGGLHLDGLMDTADGLAAGKERCLEAMQDSRVGASGVQSLIIVVLIQIGALNTLGQFAPFAMPIAAFWGRVSPLWAIANFSYLHKHNHEAIHQKNWSGLQELKPSLISILLIFGMINFLQSGITLSISMALFSGILPAIFIAQLIGRRLGGHCGDSYGASVVITETITLVILTIIFHKV